MSEHLKDLRSRSVTIRAEAERILLGSNHCEEVQNSGLSHLIPPRTIHAITTYLDPFPGFERKYALATIAATAVALADVGNVVPAATASLAIAEQTQQRSILFYSHGEPCMVRGANGVSTVQ